MMRELDPNTRRQELLVQQTAALLQSSIPSYHTLMGPDAGGSLMALPVCLTKIGPSDYPEAFLVTFKQVATATWWPPEHWTTLLPLYLTGPAQIAYQNLNPQEALEYQRVKADILDQAVVSPETYRHEQYLPGTRPRAVAQ